MLRDSISEQVLRFSRQLIPPGSSVVVAVSGGADSVALLSLLHGLRERLGIGKIVIAHLNHGLRGGESDGDERLVRALAESLNTPFFTRRLHGHRLDEPGLEAAAREERYRFFGEVRRETGCTFVATGHTSDDQAETVLMRILRGSGLNGLRGIHPLREDGVVRPLLSVTKAELVGYLRSLGIPFRNDSSNCDCRFFRNRIRNVVLPALLEFQPRVVEHLTALAAEAVERWTTQKSEVEHWIWENLRLPRENSFTIRKQGLASACASEGVRTLLAKWGIAPTRYHIDAILAETASGGTLLLPGGWRCSRGREELYFGRGAQVFSFRIPVPGSAEIGVERRKISLEVVKSVPERLDHGKWTVFIDGAALGETCVYRTVATDDVFIPFGTGAKEVPILRFLAKQGLSGPERERTGCLFSGRNKAVWIPGIRLDERFRVSESTKEVVKLQITKLFGII